MRGRTRVGDWLEEAVRKLRDADVESAHLSALLILEETTGLSRTHILAFPEEFLPEDVLPLLETLLVRRLQHEPMAYILGRKEFRERTVRVGPGVLIPRPETELLVDHAYAVCPHATRILDAGTGSGCLALSITDRFPGSVVYACDREWRAIRIAFDNDENKQVHWFRSDWLSCLRREAFDLIVSNPPYLTDTEIENLEPNVRNYEPVQALSGGEDGCAEYRKIIPQAAEALRRGGWLVLEISPTTAEIAVMLMADHCFRRIRVHCDLSGRKRILSGTKTGSSPTGRCDSGTPLC